MKRADDDDDGDLGKSCGEWWLVVVGGAQEERARKGSKVTQLRTSTVSLKHKGELL